MYKIYCVVCIWVLLPCLAYGQGLDTLLARLNRETDVSQRASLAYGIGKQYLARQVYSKASQYFGKATQDAKKTKQNTLWQEALGYRAFALMQQQEYAQAEKEYAQLLQSFAEPDASLARLQALENLVNIYKIRQEPAKALPYSEQLARLYSGAGKLTEQANSLNNLGFLHKLLGKHDEAVRYFQQALALNQQQVKRETNITTLSNLGFTYTYLKKYKEAELAYREALEIAERNNDTEQQSLLFNYLAAQKHLIGNEDGAMDNIEKAIQIGEKNKHEAILLESYKIAGEIYKKNYPREAQRYNKLYQDLKNKLDEQARQLQREIVENQIEAERKENELNQLIAAREKQALATKQAQTEKEKHEKENALQQQLLANLEKDRRLQDLEATRQRSERQGVEQQLELSRQKLLAEKTERETAQALTDAQQKQAEQQLLLQQQKHETAQAEAKRKEQQQKQALFEKEEKAKAERRVFFLYAVAGVLVLILILLVLLLVVRSNIITNRQKQALQKAKEQIQSQNEELEARQEELRQNFEELQSTQDALQEQKTQVERKNDALLASEEELKQNLEELQSIQTVLQKQNGQLEKVNEDIAASIGYAKRIQEAMLPTRASIGTYLPEYLIFFQPRDVVSGDLYWFHERDGLLFVASIDCTGHGVPGAFMSIIGESLMGKVVLDKQVKHPEEILYEMHHEIRKTLKQEDNENRDGMDVALVVLNKAEKTLEFAGAYRPLVLIQDNELQYIKGDKLSVGGFSLGKERRYTRHTFSTEKSTIFYIFSDGYQDQFGSEKNTKYSIGRLRDLLFDIHTLSVGEQEARLSSEINTWRELGKEPQLDDMLVIGVRL